MKFIVLRIPIYFISGYLILISCGTMHQMIPPQPLPRNEFRGNIVISYDFNNFTPFTSWGANFYWGAGKDCNLGFGYQPPFGISHFTAVKYLNPDKPNHENLYASLNGILLNIDYSPNFELGASFIRRSGRSYHSFSAGLWLLADNDVTEPLWKMLFWRSIGRVRFNPGLHPFIKYEFSHRDLSFSLRNNIGLTNRTVNWERRQLELEDEIALPNADIAFVTVNAVKNELQIKLNNGNSYRVTKNYPWFDAWFPNRELQKYRLNNFSQKDSIDYWYVILSIPDSESPGYSRISKFTLYELNFDSIWLDYADKKDIVIGSHPERTEAILSQIHWYRHDWSMGFGIKTSR